MEDEIADTGAPDPETDVDQTATDTVEAETPDDGDDADDAGLAGDPPVDAVTEP